MTRDARAAFLGRFQPLHRGHYRVIEEYRDRYAEFVVVVGSAETARTDENPLTADERERIIRACFPDLELAFLPDEGRGEAGYPAWTERFMAVSGADVVISGNDLVKRLVREYSDAEIVQQEMHYPERFSGTEIRRRIREGEPWRDLVPDCCEREVAHYESIIARTDPPEE